MSMQSSPESRMSLTLPPAHCNDPTVLLAASELQALGARRFADSACSFRARFAICGDREGYAVSAAEGVITFEASSPLSLLHGVYAFAEKCWGFCFFEPGIDTLMPWSEAFAELNGPLLTSPRPLLKRRGFIQEFPFDADSPALADWMAKNQLNYLLVWMKYYDAIVPETRTAFEVRGIEIESGHHNFDYWISAKSYAGSHPEFFAMRDGQRRIPAPGADALLMGEQLCTTNPALREEIARRMAEYLHQHPELRTISLIPNDGFGWCECETCAKLYDPKITGEAYSVSAHVYKADRIYHDLITDVSSRLRTAGVEATLTLCAYVNYSAPAPGFKLPKGTAVHFAPYWRCVNHALSDDACWINRAYDRDLKAWVAAKDGGEVNIYEYLMGINLYVSLPLIFHEAIFDEAANHARLGVDGYLTQFQLTNWTAYGLNYSMMAKALRGEDRDVAVSLWFDAMFGPSAAEARALYAKLLAIQKGAGAHLITYPRALFHRTHIQDFRQALGLAEKLATGSASPFAARLRNWAEYLVKFKELYDLYQAGQARKEDIETFRSWCHALRSDHTIADAKLDVLLNAWLARFGSGDWLHFNLTWEDAYITAHDTALNATQPPDEATSPLRT